jgi:hypothetical protein
LATSQAALNAPSTPNAKTETISQWMKATGGRVSTPQISLLVTTLMHALQIVIYPVLLVMEAIYANHAYRMETYGISKKAPVFAQPVSLTQRILSEYLVLLC